jgi:hypothetical protein
LGSDPAGLALADLDGDGDLDVAAARNGSTAIAPVAVLRGNGNGTLGPATTFGSGGRAVSVAVGDLNVDGKKDLILCGPSGIRVLLGNGDGTFGTQASYVAGISFESVAIGDVNGDGKPDVAASTRNRNTVSVLLGNGDGTLAPKTEYGTGDTPVALAIADLNGDGWPDLVTADYVGNTATVLINQPPPTTAVLLTLFTASWVGVAIEVRWRLRNETLAIPRIERSNAMGGPWATVDGEARWEGEEQVLVDGRVVAGTTYFYRLIARQPDGTSRVYGPISSTGDVTATDFQILRISPNPAMGPARIEFATTQPAPVRVYVLDLLGRRVALLVNETLPAGRHEVVWTRPPGARVPPTGLYFVRFEWPRGATTRRLVVTK